MHGMGGAVLVVAGVGAAICSGEIGTVYGVSKATEGTCCCGPCNMGGVVGGGV